MAMLERVEVNGGGGVSEEDTLVLNTKTKCFLCLNEVPFSRQNNGSIQVGGSKCSLRSICRHLNVKFNRELFKNELVGTAHSEIVQFLEQQQEEDGEIPDVAVKLCQKCCTVVSKLSELCVELEDVKFKVNCYLREFYKVLELSSGKTGGNSEGQITTHVIGGTAKNGVRHEKIAEIIRKEIKGKCFEKLDLEEPKALVTYTKEKESSLSPDGMKNEMESQDNSPKIVSTFTQSLPTPAIPQFSIQQITPGSTASSTTTTAILLPATPIFFFNNGTGLLEQVQDDTSTQNTTTTLPAAEKPAAKKKKGPSLAQRGATKTYKCAVCAEPFSNKHSVIRHRRFAHPQKISQDDRNCSLCNLKFRYNSDFIKHIKFECQYRGDAVNSKQFNSSALIPSSRGSKKQFICKLCDPHLTMGTQRGFKEHLIRNHVETLMTAYKLPHISMREFKEFCDHTFQVEVLSSAKGHNAEGNPCVQCSHCSNSYSNHYTLRQHFYIVHEKIMSEKLIHLQMTSTLEDIMAIDLPTFSFPANERWTCVSCGATFAQDTSLYKHRRHICKYRFENRLENSTCEICGKVCSSTQSKVVHKRKVHGNAPPISTSTSPQSHQVIVTNNAGGGTETENEKYIPIVDIGEDSDIEDILEILQEEDDVPMIVESSVPSNSSTENLHTCTLCIPHCQLQEEDIKRHQVENHVETLFDSSCKLPSMTMADFKVYSDHTLKMEMLSTKTECNELGNSIFYCSHCSKRYASQGGLSLHILSEHKQLVSTKLLELQQKYTVAQIKAMDKTASSFTTVKDTVLQKQKDSKATSGAKANGHSKSLTCDICNKTFNHRGSLWTHKKRIHSSKIQVASTFTLTNNTGEETTDDAADVHHYSLQWNNSDHDDLNETEQDEQSEEDDDGSPQEYCLIDENSSMMYSEVCSDIDDNAEMSMEVLELLDDDDDPLQI